MRRAVVSAVLAALLLSGCGPKAPSGRKVGKAPVPGVELAIFAPQQRGAGGGAASYALITERRELELAKGDNVVRFAGVPRTVDGASVTFRSFTDPAGTVVVAQGFAFDAASPSALLDGQVGTPVVVVTDSGEVNGKLVAFDVAGITIETENGLRVVPADEALRAIRLAPRPEGFQTTPTLLWHVTARRAGRHLVEVTYQAGRIGWQAHHRLLIHNAIDGSGAAPRADLATMITLVNDSGHSFEGVAAELIAVDEPAAPAGGRKPPRAPAPAYQLAGLYDLPAGTTREIAYEVPAMGIEAHRVLRYDGAAAVPLRDDAIADQSYGLQFPMRTIVTEDVVLTSKAPLPAGRVQVYQQPDGGEPVLVADSLIERTAASEPVRVEVGRAREVTAIRKRLSYRASPKNHKFTESFEITIHNQSALPVDAVVVERLYRAPTWEITDETHLHRARDARLVEFPLTVPAGKKARVKYTVEYRY